MDALTPNDFTLAQLRTLADLVGLRVPNNKKGAFDRLASSGLLTRDLIEDVVNAPLSTSSSFSGAQSFNPERAPSPRSPSFSGPQSTRSEGALPTSSSFIDEELFRPRPSSFPLTTDEASPLTLTLPTPSAPSLPSETRVVPRPNPFQQGTRPQDTRITTRANQVLNNFPSWQEIERESAVLNQLLNEVETTYQNFEQSALTHYQTQRRVQERIGQIAQVFREVQGDLVSVAQQQVALEERDQRVAQLQAQLEQERQVLTQERNQVIQVQEDLLRANQTLTLEQRRELEGRIAQLREEEAVLTQRAQQANQEREVLARNATALQQEQEALLVATRTLEQRQADLDRYSVELDQRALALEQQAQELARSSQFNPNDQVIVSLNSQAQEQREALRDQALLLAQAQDEVSALNSRLASQQEECRVRLVEVNNELALARQENRSNPEYEELVDALRNRLAERSRELSDARRELNTLTAQNAEQQAQLQAQVEQLALTQQQVLQMREQCQRDRALVLAEERGSLTRQAFTQIREREVQLLEQQVNEARAHLEAHLAYHDDLENNLNAWLAQNQAFIRELVERDDEEINRYAQELRALQERLARSRGAGNVIIST